MKWIIAFLMSAVLPFISGAQTLQYTSNKIPVDNESPIIIGAFRDTLHIVKKDKDGMRLYTYNRNMEFLESKLLHKSNKGEQYEVLQDISYAHYYYLFLGSRRREKALVLKVYPSGKFEDQTSRLTSELAGLFPNHISISKFQKVEDQCLLSIMYYDSSQQKAYLSVHYLDSMLVKKAEHTVSLVYNQYQNYINDVMFPDVRTAYIVKSYRPFSENAGQVDIFHYSFASESATKVTIAEKGMSLSNPLLHYNAQDSTLLFFSTVRSLGRQGLSNQNKYYSLAFNKVLDETSLPRLTEIKNIQNEKAVFIINKVHDVSFNNMSNTVRTPNVYYSARPPIYDPVRGYYVSDRTYGSRYVPNFELGHKRTDVNLRLVWSDQQSGLKNDTLLTTKKTRFKAEYLNSFLFRSAGKYTMFYCINYSARGKTISYVSVDGGKFSEEEFLPVNHRNDYMLYMAEKLNEHQLLIPYTYRGSLGFLKISMKR
jgi:hypothetical protein